MAVSAKKLYTPAEYIAREREVETRSEYIAGEIFAMAGASVFHNRITRNLMRQIDGQLRGKDCEAFGSDLRVATSASHYCYPDLTVVCGELELTDASLDTLTNPTLIVEVLSPTTEAWDRGGKAQRYRRMASLQEYILVSQDRPHIERYVRQANGQWLLSEVNGLDASLPLEAIGCALALAAVYEQVTWPSLPAE